MRRAQVAGYLLDEIPSEHDSHYWVTKKVWSSSCSPKDWNR